MKKRQFDISGKRYGRLVAIKVVGQTKHGKRTWLTNCDCGNEKIAVGASLISGHVKSCGYCGSQRRWTKEEDQFLIDNHERYTHREFAEKLKRSISSVAAHRCRKGLFAAESVRREALRSQKMGTNNPNWKGEKCGRRSGNCRARRLYLKCQPCIICGAHNGERHHKDGDTLNNSPANIVFLCRRHHMEADGRLARLIRRNRKEIT